MSVPVMTVLIFLSIIFGYRTYECMRTGVTTLVAAGADTVTSICRSDDEQWGRTRSIPAVQVSAQSTVLLVGVRVGSVHVAFCGYLMGLHLHLSGGSVCKDN